MRVGDSLTLGKTNPVFRGRLASISTRIRTNFLQAKPMGRGSTSSSLSIWSPMSLIFAGDHATGPNIVPRINQFHPIQYQGTNLWKQVNALWNFNELSLKYSPYYHGEIENERERLSFRSSMVKPDEKFQTLCRREITEPECKERWEMSLPTRMWSATVEAWSVSACNFQGRALQDIACVWEISLEISLSIGEVSERETEENEREGTEDRGMGYGEGVKREDKKQRGRKRGFTTERKATGGPHPRALCH